jgi:hypothetical protein
MKLSRLERTILSELRNAGKYGILGRNLAGSSWRFGATIYLLRGHGFNIKTTHMWGSTWRYTLMDRLPVQGSLFDNKGRVRRYP